MNKYYATINTYCFYKKITSNRMQRLSARGANNFCTYKSAWCVATLSAVSFLFLLPRGCLAALGFSPASCIALVGFLSTPPVSSPSSIPLGTAHGGCAALSTQLHLILVPPCHKPSICVKDSLISFSRLSCSSGPPHRLNSKHQGEGFR